LNNLDKILIFSCIITPFTLLRLGFIGFGEITLLILFLYGLRRGYLSLKLGELIFSQFWSRFLVISIFGFMFNVLFLSHKTGTFEGMLFDFSAYIMVLISCMLIEGLIKKERIHLFYILKNIFIFSGLSFVTLYFVSLYTNVLFGLPLKYHDFFAPLANNLHQTAMIMVPLIFLGLFVFEKEKHKLRKYFYLFIVISLSYVALETGSFKAYIGVVFGWGVYLMLMFFNLFKGKLKNMVIAITAFTLLLLSLSNWQQIEEKAIVIFQEEDIGEGRSSLYSNALVVGLTSPIVGLGPGPHIFKGNKFWDSHETFLTVFIQSGIIGLLLLLVLVFRIFKKMTREPALLAAVLPIFIYLLGGDIMRRLPVWLLLLFIYYYVELHSNNKLIKE